MNKKAYYGEFGGQFVSESLMNTLKELDDAFEKAIRDAELYEGVSLLLRAVCRT